MRKTVRTSGRPEPEILGQILRTLREKKGLSQREFAARLGRTHSFLGRLESGALQIDLPTLFDISEELGVDALEIVGHVRDESLRRRGTTNP